MEERENYTEHFWRWVEEKIKNYRTLLERYEGEGKSYRTLLEMSGGEGKNYRTFLEMSG